MKKFGLSLLLASGILAVYFIGCDNTTKTNTPNTIDTNRTTDINLSDSNTTVDSNVMTIDFKAIHAKYNEAAYIPPQCYTKTVDENDNAHNPCFSCHINSDAPNYINDPDLQEVYDMSEYSKKNRYTNLFKDKTEAVSKISDEEILTYVRQNNYKENNTLLLAKKLQTALPTEWDVNENGKWDGYTPDCYFNFDNEGFDKNPNGDYTGWRAFAYYPFLGTFWPTNGSTDDVLIRLPEIFRQDSNGDFNLTIYKTNLSIVESLIKKQDVAIDTIDETLIDTDLNQDGKLTTANVVKYNWVKPTFNQSTRLIGNFSMTYVGKVKALLVTNEYLIAPGLYPKGTEFLHTVRYIDVNEDNTSIQMATRMKELRYGKKSYWNSYAQLQNASLAEIKEKDVFPDRLRKILGDTEEGLSTGLGWTYQGFIEDEHGDLRPQNYEETRFCIGCHSGVGATADSTFAFQRKFDKNALQQGWYHWSQKPDGLKNIPEPKTPNGKNEYSFYLEQNRAGDEFRANMEVIEKFFDDENKLKEEEIKKLNNDITHLIYPSTERALELNKAYKVIVDEQSYIYGRDANVKPVENVHKEVELGQPTEVERVEF